MYLRSVKRVTLTHTYRTQRFLRTHSLWYQQWGSIIDENILLDLYALRVDNLDVYALRDNGKHSDISPRIGLEFSLSEAYLITL